MPYLSREQLECMGFAHLGYDVRISDRASIYDADSISLGDHARIDDFCVVSGNVRLGRNVHLAVFCNVAGGTEGVIFEDFSGLAYGCHVFSQSDDYSGATMTNATVPRRYKNERRERVQIGRHSIVGTNAIVLPGVVLGEGTAIGAGSVVTQSTEPWSLYLGNPARKLRTRQKDLLELEAQYLEEEERG